MAAVGVVHVRLAWVAHYHDGVLLQQRARVPITAGRRTSGLSGLARGAELAIVNGNFGVPPILL